MTWGLLAANRKFRTMKRLGKPIHRIAAAVTAVTLMQGSAGIAWAATISDVSDNIRGSVVTTPKLLNAACYLSASVLTVAGIYGIKQHSDSPQSVPLKNGVAKLATAGALFSGPYVALVIQDTMRAGDDSTAGQEFIAGSSPSY